MHSPIYYVGQPAAANTASISKHSSRYHSYPSQPPLHIQPTLRYAPSDASLRKSASSSPPPSDVPTAVATLLGLTRQLQDVLRLWADREASEAQVSDAFVLVAMQFNATVNAFTRLRIDMKSVSFSFFFSGFEYQLTDGVCRDLLSIPSELRAVLEDCLGQTPSPSAFAHYIPHVRTVLFHLLQGLQRKQAPYRRALSGFSSSSSSSSSRSWEDDYPSTRYHR
jgi:hypothetical protein